ncbi:hypothetical protein HML84_01645 [Alcanivorax sp. IO_7]|nr:hypothetical protein HML84_01645 [Alcanivorax sp. IO_7]
MLTLLLAGCASTTEITTRTVTDTPPAEAGRFCWLPRARKATCAKPGN